MKRVGQPVYEHIHVYRRVKEREREREEKKQKSEGERHLEWEEEREKISSRECVYIYTQAYYTSRGIQHFDRKIQYGSYICMYTRIHIYINIHIY